MATVTSINIFPVKGLGGIPLEQGTVTERGFLFDREWLIIDHRNRFVTQREIPEMALLRVGLDQQQLLIERSGFSSHALSLQMPQGERKQVKIWRDQCGAIDQGEATSAWLTDVLGPYKGQPLRMVRFAPDTVRAVNPQHLADESATVGFADGYPYLITVQESLDDLNQNLERNLHDHVPMNRFRSNIVIEGLPAWQENKVDHLTCKDSSIRLALRKPCERCKVTTINQDTAAVSKDRQPLRTLISMNPFKDLRGGYFGQNATLLSGENNVLSVGDSLEIKYK